MNLAECMTGAEGASLPADASAGSRDDEMQVWREYRRTGDVALRNELIARNEPIVIALARRLKRTVPRSVDLDTLQSAGYTGLMDAVDAFDPDRGIKFKTFCTWRIHGSILDELRKLDWVPRGLRRGMALADRAIGALEAELGRPPTDEELGDRMGVDGTDANALRHGPKIVVSIHEPQPGANGADGSMHVPDARGSDLIDAVDSRDVIESLMRGLAPKEQAILRMYYLDGKTMRDIGEQLGITESRVCQIHSNLLARLKVRLAGRVGEIL